MELDKIYQEDCLDTLAKIPDNFVNLVVTSPPYNKNKWIRNRSHHSKDSGALRVIQYDSYEDSREKEDYINWQKKIINECLRILKPDGSMFYNHIDILSELNTIHPSYIYDFPLKQTIIWDRSNTPKLDKSYFYPITEYIFWLKKDKDSKPKFDRRNCFFQKCVWRFGADTQNNHPAPFPVKLASNCILSCTDEGDIVYDPFMGSGTTAVSCVLHNRKFIGSEISEEYVKVAEKRLKVHQNQTKLSF